MKDFRKLQVWQKAHETVLMLYRATQGFPAEERFGLTAQMRRAAVSVGSNIAKDAGRGSDPAFARLLQIAFGSASELEYQVVPSRDLSFLSETVSDELLSRLGEVKRMLAALLKKLDAES
jgi:four helix bundle protein